MEDSGHIGDVGQGPHLGPVEVDGSDIDCVRLGFPEAGAGEDFTGAEVSVTSSWDLWGSGS